MPSPRKRIGFLPSLEVQIIIDKICNHNKLSQSKVTGILVEEALSFRGIFKNSKNKISNDLENDDSGSSIINAENFNREQSNNNNDNLNFDEDFLNEKVQMIEDYIEFKLFKKIMNKSLKKF